MIELAKHIEVLLLENDCVIVPGLGGFIAHYRSSVLNERTGEFCPPARTIGFNPQLTMNDGLLVQSYMQAYNTDFPDATRKIEKIVAQLKEDIYQQGHISLNNVGTLYYNMNGIYEFEPVANGFFTPSLYGLDSFILPKLAQERVETPSKDWSEATSCNIKIRTRRSFLRHRHWSKNIMAVAAAILLFFLFSIPVENTYMEDAEYASLGSAGLFDAIRNHSMASCVISPDPQAQNKGQQSVEKKYVRNNINTLKPVTVKTEKVAAVPKPAVMQTPKASKPEVPDKVTNVEPQQAKVKKQTGNYYIIVASLTTEADALQEIKQLKQKGYNNAQVLESKGRFRIALECYANQTEAYKKTQDLKKDAKFASAWVFTSK